MTITIIGRRWFDKRAGNTYFSACALIDGVSVASIEYEYGYGSQYEQEMFNLLEHLTLLPEPRMHYNNGSSEAFWVYCDRLGITHASHVSDVGRKKDL